MTSCRSSFRASPLQKPHTQGACRPCHPLPRPGSPLAAFCLCLVWMFCKKGVTHCVTISARPCSLHVFLKFIHIAACPRTPFLSEAERSIVWLVHSSCVRSSLAGRWVLSTLWLLGVVLLSAFMSPVCLYMGPQSFLGVGTQEKNCQVLGSPCVELFVESHAGCQRFT